MECCPCKGRLAALRSHVYTYLSLPWTRRKPFHLSFSVQHQQTHTHTNRRPVSPRFFVKPTKSTMPDDQWVPIEIQYGPLQCMETATHEIAPSTPMCNKNVFRNIIIFCSRRLLLVSFFCKMQCG